jgi:hypothetical protein
MTKSNILFLDLDGPAFPYAVIRYHPHNNDPYPGDFEMGETLKYWRMCERFRYMWDHLCETRDFKVVLSTSWRKYYNKESCFHDLFKVNGLELNLHEDWKTVNLKQSSYGPYTSGYDRYDCLRASEISEWIVRHKEIESFLILDDAESGYSLYADGQGWNKVHDYMKDEIIMVDVDAGLSSGNIMKILNKTEGWMI